MNQFNPYTDLLSLNFFCYLNNNNPQTLNSLLSEINKLSISQLFEVSPNGSTRLLFMIEKLNERGQLEQNISIISNVLNHSNKLEKNNPLVKQSPTAFLLFTENLNKISSYQLSRMLEHSRLNRLLECLSKENINLVICLKFQIRNGPMPTINLVAKQQWTENLIQYNIVAQNNIKRINPINYVKSIFNSIDGSNHTFLESIVRSDFTSQDFNKVLSLLISARKRGWLEKSDYKKYLLENCREGFSILHQLILSNDTLGPTNLLTYLLEIDTVLKEHVLSNYTSILKYSNTNGYSVMHQAINAPDLKIAKTFLHWFEHECSLPDNNKLTLLDFKNPDSPTQTKGAKCAPRRSNFKYGCRDINLQVERLKRKYATPTSIRQTLYGSFFETQDSPVSIDTQTTDSEKIWCEELKGWYLSGNEYLDNSASTLST